MGKAGRRKRDGLAFQTFDGAGCSSGLPFELAPSNESGYSGVSHDERQMAGDHPRRARWQEGPAQRGQL